MEHKVRIKGEVLGRWLVGWRGVVVGDVSTYVQHIPTTSSLYKTTRDCIKGGWDWQLQWRRLFGELEIVMVAKFMEDIRGVVVQPDQQDSWCWGADPSGRYTMASAYKLFSSFISVENNDDVFKELWKVKVSSKMSCFPWRLIRDRLSTKMNLSRRNVTLNDIICPFCRTSEEDASHLFVGCEKIRPLWWEASSWLSIVGVYPETPTAHFLQHTHGYLKGIRT